MINPPGMAADKCIMPQQYYASGRIIFLLCVVPDVQRKIIHLEDGVMNLVAVLY